MMNGMRSKLCGHAWRNIHEKSTFFRWGSFMDVAIERTLKKWE